MQQLLTMENVIFTIRERNAGTLFWLWQVQNMEEPDAFQGLIHIVTLSKMQFSHSLTYSSFLPSLDSQ